MKKIFILPEPQNSLPPLFGPDKPWLAPMAGYSDLPFRLLCAKLGAATCVTEMISAAGLCMQSQATADLLLNFREEAPLVVQLFGSDPAYASAAAKMLRRAGWLYFDFNMGCPASKIIRQGSGSALLKNGENALMLAKQLIMAVKTPLDDYKNPEGKAMLGFKLRSAFDAAHPLPQDFALRLEDMGADWLALHPRYGKQGYAGEARWEEIARLKERLSIPLLASGDLLTAAKGVGCLQATGATGVMYARGALHNPAIFREHAQLLKGGDITVPSKSFLVDIIRQHINLSMLHYTSPRGFNKIRSILPRYARGHPGVGQLRQNLAHCLDWDCLIQEIEKFLET